MSEQRPEPPVKPFPPGSRVAVIASRWNGAIVEPLLEGCLTRLTMLDAEVESFRVPGAYELPTAAKWAAGGGAFAAVICLGCVIRGETPHFDYVAGECARGVMRVSLDTGVPVIFGVLTTNTMEQAQARSGGEHGHAGIAAAEAAAEMVVLKSVISSQQSAADLET